MKFYIMRLKSWGNIDYKASHAGCWFEINYSRSIRGLFSDIRLSNIAAEAFANICCLANLDVSIVYSVSKLLILRVFILSTIAVAIAEECLKRLIRAPNFESSLEV